MKISRFLLVLIYAINTSAAKFKYIPLDWPSVADANDGYGYFNIPTLTPKLNALFPAPEYDPSLSIPVNEPFSTQKCPSSLNATAIGINGSCWWTCGNLCLRPSDISTCNGPKTLGLSFDDGPVGNWTLKLLSYLQKNNLKATFFLIGASLVQHPEIATALFAAGMELGVHTWSHHPLTTESNDAIRAELGWTILAFQNVLGITPKLFRPPYGDIDDRVRFIAKSMGLSSVIWDADTKDYTTLNHPELVASAVTNFENVLNTGNFPNGVITLEHDFFQGGPDLAIENFIPYDLSQGYNVESVGKCMGLSTTGWYSISHGRDNKVENPNASATSYPCLFLIILMTLITINFN